MTGHSPRPKQFTENMALQEHNYWLTTAAFPKTDATRPLPERVDVAVIGAGFTGLSAARTLAKRGAKVCVLESETIGWGASSRNGGMVLSGMKLGVNKLISMYGRELTQRMYAASLATIDCVEQIVARRSYRLRFFPLRTSRSRVQAKAFRRLRAAGRSDCPRVSITDCVLCRNTN